MRGGSRFEQLEVPLGPGPHEIARPAAPPSSPVHVGAAYIDNVEGQADSDARAIGIRLRPWGVPRAARVIGAGEAAVDEGGEGREDEEEE